jgi:hypothetical protein
MTLECSLCMSEAPSCGNYLHPFIFYEVHLGQGKGKTQYELSQWPTQVRSDAGADSLLDIANCTTRLSDKRQDNMRLLLSGQEIAVPHGCRWSRLARPGYCGRSVNSQRC